MGDAPTADAERARASLLVGGLAQLHGVSRAVVLHCLLCCSGDAVLANRVLRKGPAAVRAERPPHYFEQADDLALAAGTLADRPADALERRRAYLGLNEPD